MGFLLKLLIGGSVLSLLAYLVLEVLKLRTKVKSLMLQLSTTESFNSNIPSSEDIQTEIDKYKEELAELNTLDTMVNQLKYDINNEQGEDDEDDEDNISIENEPIDYENIENELENDTETENESLELESTQIKEENNNTFSLETETEMETTPNTKEESLAGMETDTTETKSTSKEITDSDMKFLLDKFNKNTLKTMCSENKLTKGGSKTDLIIRLLEKNILQKELPTANTILKSLEITSDEYTNKENVEEVEEVEEALKPEQEFEIELENNVIEEISTNVLQNVPIDSLLYSLREINGVSNENMNNEIQNLMF